MIWRWSDRRWNSHAMQTRETASPRTEAIHTLMHNKARPSQGQADNILYVATYWQCINNILKTYWQYTVCNTILTTYCLETIHVQSDNILFVTPYRQNNDDINSTFRKYSNFKNTAYLKWMYISHREFH